MKLTEGKARSTCEKYAGVCVVTYLWHVTEPASLQLGIIVHVTQQTQVTCVE